MVKPVITYHDGESTQIKERYFVDENDRKQGPYKAFYTTGRVRIQCIYKDGKKNGPYKDYRLNGQLYEECTYKDDKKDGVCKTYHENGVLLREEIFKNGKQNGPLRSYYENGHKCVRAFIKDGEWEGAYIKYTKYGSPEKVGAYINGRFIEGREAYREALKAPMKELKKTRRETVNLLDMLNDMSAEGIEMASIDRYAEKRKIAKEYREKTSGLTAAQKRSLKDR